LKNGTIAIGWAELGDLKSVSNKELKEKISQLPPKAGDPKQIYNTLIKGFTLQTFRLHP
jgi:hypothetical protein